MFGPGLEVEGVGVVGLPLSNSVIKDLIKVCAQATRPSNCSMCDMR